MITKEFTDDRGIRRRVRVRNEYDPPGEGIPVDVYDELDELYAEAPLSFRRSLYERLWDRGLIEPADFAKRDAVTLYRQALQSSLARDARDAITYIDKREQFNHEQAT